MWRRSRQTATDLARENWKRPLMRRTAFTSMLISQERIERRHACEDVQDRQLLISQERIESPVHLPWVPCLRHLISQERIESFSSFSSSLIGLRSDLARENWKSGICVAITPAPPHQLISQERIERKILCRGLPPDLWDWSRKRELKDDVVYYLAYNPIYSFWSRKRELKAISCSLSHTQDSPLLISQERIERQHLTAQYQPSLSQAPDLARENWKVTKALYMLDRAVFTLISQERIESLARLAGSAQPPTALISQERIERHYFHSNTCVSQKPDLARENWKSYNIADSTAKIEVLISQERIERNAILPCIRFPETIPDLARENWKVHSAHVYSDSSWDLISQERIERIHCV